MNKLHNFLNRLKIKYKYIFVVLPFVFISYLIIGYGVYYISFNLSKDMISNHAEQTIIEKTSYFDKYLENILISTDKMFYNNDMQNYLVQKQSSLSKDDYLKLKDNIQQYCYSYLTKGYERLYDVDIRNVYIKNIYDEIIITDAVYSDTIGRVSKLMDLYESSAQKKHGQVYLACEGPNHLYFIRTIYKNDIDNSDKQIGMVIVDLNLRFFSQNIIDSTNNQDISFALLDENKNVVINCSTLPDEDCQDIISNNKNSYQKNIYKPIFHQSKYSGYSVVGIINETMLYNDFNRIITMVLALIFISILIIVGSILFASQVVSSEFDRFIKKIKKTDTLGKHALITSQSKDEFNDLSIVYNDMINRVNTLSKAVYEKEISLKNAEIQAFQAQINPHFLYNTLDCINSLVGLNKIKETQKTVIALANIMRMSIKGPNFLTIEDEINYIHEYIYIQKMRYQDRILFLVEIDKNLNKLIIPKLILQPIVENAIKHGVSNSLKQGMIVILGNIENDDIIFKIRDNGVGMDDKIINSINEYNINSNFENNKNNDSIGLINIQKRLKLIYTNDYGIKINKLSNGGTEVIIKLSKNFKQ